MSELDGPEGEMYHDVIKNEMRRRRGKRRRSRGAYSAAEKRMSRAFQYMLAAMHYMDGELADATANDWALLFTRGQVIHERYSYQNTGPNLRARGIDLHVVRKELDLFVPEPTVEDVDIYKNLGDALSLPALLLTRARRR